MAEKIFLLEDDAYLRDGLLEMLQGRDYEVESAESIKKAEIIIKEKRFSLLIFDVMLSDGSSFDLCERLRAQGVTTPILFLTACDEEYQIVRGLDAGGDDYVTKPFSPLELVARVKSQLRRYTQLGGTAQNENDKIYSVGGLRINDDLKEVTVDGELVRLTPIEYNILLLLMKNQGRVFSINQIYEMIWNEEAIGADNTVAVHIRHIREKIEINPKEPRYLKVVWGVGYKIEKVQ